MLELLQTWKLNCSARHILNFSGSLGTMTQRLNGIKPGALLIILLATWPRSYALPDSILSSLRNRTAHRCYQALWNEESWLHDHKWFHVYVAKIGKLNSHVYFFTSAMGSTGALVLGNDEKPTQMYTEQTPLFAMLPCLFWKNVDLLIIKFRHVADTSGSLSISHRK